MHSVSGLAFFIEFQHCASPYTKVFVSFIDLAVLLITPLQYPECGISLDNTCIRNLFKFSSKFSLT